MKCKLIFASVVLVLFSAVRSKHETYYGYKTYNLKIVDSSQVASLDSIGRMIELDFWQEPILGRDGLVMIKPANGEYFEDQLRKAGVEYSIHSANVKKLLDDCDQTWLEYGNKSYYQSISDDQIDLNRYYRYDEIVGYISKLAYKYSDKVKLAVAGHSFEGRPIYYVKVSSSNFTDRTKPIIMLDAAIHAREWISPPVALYILQQLVVGSAAPDLLNDVDWIIVPVVNPDGYEYTHTDDRLWRKTMSTTHEGGLECPGVDGNRNYNFAWMEAGASSDPCSLTYAGPYAFSETETQAVNDIMLQNLERIKLYISFHSYGSLLLYSWGHNGTVPDNADDLFKIGSAIGETIDTIKLPEADNYTVGNSAQTLYLTSGSSRDYARMLGIPLSYTMELPSIGYYFELPPSYIEQVVTETWAGIAAGARAAVKL